MNDSTGMPRNPFSPSAVARITRDGDDVTVNTEAVEKATAYLDAYLATTVGEHESSAMETPEAEVSPRQGHGKVMAVVGDYGVGKTHLSVHLLRRARRANRPDGPTGIVVHDSYLEAPTEGFERLYRDFVRMMDRDDLMTALTDHFRDIVAAALATSPLTERTAQKLRNRVMHPDEAIDSLGLIESMLSRELRKALLVVTRNEVFADALTMLLRRKEFAGDIWEWIEGKDPSPALADRGIRNAIRGSEMALEALGVFAYLFGRRNHRFFMVIDELDNILTTARQPDQTAIVAFRKLFDVFRQAGAFLVVVGLPDLFEILRDGTLQRIDLTIDMPPLGSADVVKLIDLTQREATGEGGLGPFAEEVPALVAKLTGGSARQIVRLCYGAYERALLERSDVISEEIVLAVAGEGLPFITEAEVSRLTRRQLERQAIPFQQRQVLGDDKPVEVGFWVPGLSRDSGCAIIVTRAVVRESDVKDMRKRANRVRAVYPKSQVIVVVAGYLHADLRDGLHAATGTDPIGFDRRTFADDLGRAVETARSAEEEWTADEVTRRILEKLDWLNQQQAQMQMYTDRFEGRVSDLQTAVQRLETSTAQDAQGTASAATSDPLPLPVATVFHEAVEELERGGLLQALMPKAIAPSGEAGAVIAQREVRERLQAEGTYPLVGATTVLRQLVDAFRRGIEDWFRRRGDDPGDPRGNHAALLSICQAYESVYYDLNRVGLRDYPPTGWTDVEDPELWGGRRSMREHFDGLAARVQEAALRLTK